MEGRGASESETRRQKYRQRKGGRETERRRARESEKESRQESEGANKRSTNWGQNERAGAEGEEMDEAAALSGLQTRSRWCFAHIVRPFKHTAMSRC